MMNRWMTRRNRKEKGTTTAIGTVLQKEKLPLEAVERILSQLPLPALVRTCCVCKQWHALISSPRFLHARAEIPSVANTPYFPVVFSRSYGRKCCAFDFSTHQWQRLAPLNFVPYRVTYVAGAGGLFCLRNCFELLVVCNPITRQWKNLPRSTGQLCASHSLIHMVLDVPSTSYKIITISGSCKTEIYDRSSQKWDITSNNLPPGVTSIRGRTAAFCNGFLYCIVDEGMGSKLSGIIAYDLQLAMWSSMLIVLPSGFGEARSSNSLQPGSLAASLIECRGHVMLVAEKMQLGATLVSIFELQLTNITWIEVATLPHDPASPFESFKHGLRCDGVVVHGNVICLTSQSGDMAALDVSTLTWTRLPDCPLVLGKNADIDIAVFPFLPSLDAPV
nr:hypothetical protein PHYPA_030049 [Physcomitrium patens]